jgi:hypothetical protein
VFRTGHAFDAPLASRHDVIKCEQIPATVRKT